MAPDSAAPAGQPPLTRRERLMHSPGDMRLYATKIPIIAKEIIRQLTAAQQLEVNNPDEAELDIQSVLKEYVRRDREVTEETKDILERRGLSHSQFGKVKRQVAERKAHGMGDEGMIWICNQILETFMQSQFVEEVFAGDVELRKAMTEIIRKHTAVDEELDTEVRQRIKNLAEGSAQWDVEYARVMEQIRRNRGLTE